MGLHESVPREFLRSQEMGLFLKNEAQKVKARNIDPFCGKKWFSKQRGIYCPLPFILMYDYNLES